MPSPIPPLPAPSRRLGLALALLLGASGASAHQLWLEQADQVIHLRFGEYADNLRERSPGLLDKLVQPQARLQRGDQLLPLALRRGSDGFALPMRAGRGESLLVQDDSYPLIERRDGERVLSRSAWIPAARWVLGPGALAPQLTLDLLPQDEPGSFRVVYKGQVLPKARVEVVSPSGWSRSVLADEQGRLRLELPWRGQYVLEVKHQDPSGGERAGQRYEQALYVTTLSLVQTLGPAAPPPPPPAAPSQP